MASPSDIMKIIWPDLLVATTCVAIAALDIAHIPHADFPVLLMCVALLWLGKRQTVVPKTAGRKLYLLSMAFGLSGLFFIVCGHMLVHMTVGEAKSVGYLFLGTMSLIDTVRKVNAIHA